jgi:rhodanese-related sulfurtransferase
MSCLLSTPLFRQVPPAHIQQLFTRFHSQAVKAGDAVIKEGEEGDYFYVVEQGHAQVSSVAGHIDVVLAPGDYFGEEALVGNTKRNATITMSTDGQLMRLGKDDFTTLLHEPVQKYISWDDLQDLNEESYQLIDVRLPIEFRHLHINGSRNMPLMTLRQTLVGLDSELQYVVPDDAGRRTHLAAYLLCQAGLKAIILQDAGRHYPEAV